MALALYPRSSYDAFHGLQIQYPPDVDQAVQQIYAACKGFGTDEQTLIAVLGSKSPETRTLISMRYQELYKKPLKDLVKSETSGDFGRLLRMLSTPLHETEASLLREATKGMGTNENQIVQIISGRTNEEMDILKKTYFRLFNKDLAVTLSSELSGDFRKVIMALLQSPMLPFNPTFHTAAKAEEEAIKLYKAGQGRLGTNEEVFIATIAVAPPEFLRMMDAAYVRKYSNNIAKAVEKEFSGDAKRSLVHLVKCVMDAYPTIAELFERTMKGFGTDETGLSTALVRYHSVLHPVKEAYKKLYGKELRDRIYGETSGDYRRLLLEVYDAPQDPPAPRGPRTPAGAPTGGPVPTPGRDGYGGASPGGNATPGGHGAVPSPTQQAFGAPGGQGAYPSPASGQAPRGPGGGAASPAYPTPAGYPPQQQQAPGQGYPPQQQPAPGQGYPSQQAAGYPPQHQAPGYPPQQAPAPGYPPQQAPGPGYPHQQPQGYPPQQPPGYPPQQAAAPGYPPHQAPAPGYPPQHAPSPGYPPQQAQPYGYPPQQQAPPQPGYPPAQPGYPPQGQYPPAQPGYPPAQPGYPPAQPGYPPQHAQPGYPPQGQYPPAQPGYAPQQHGQYPPAYPPQGQYPPAQGYPGYPPRGY